MKTFETLELEKIPKPDEGIEERKESIKKEKKVHSLEHAAAFLGESFWGKRAKAIVENSEIGEVIGNIEKEDIVIVDIGSGKQHINRAILDVNPDKDIKVIGVDQSDKATKKASFSDKEKVIESVYGIGDAIPAKDEENSGETFIMREALPIRNESADVVKFDFTFQGANEEKRKQLLESAKRILKKDGIITVIDHLALENPNDDKEARSQNYLLNKGLSKFDEKPKNEEEWINFFKDNGLEVEKSKPYREDNKSGEKYPPQYILFVLKKTEQAEAVEQKEE